MAIMIRQQILLRNWETPGQHPLKDWVTELGKVVAYERMSYRMHDKTEKYPPPQWGMYISFIHV